MSWRNETPLVLFLGALTGCVAVRSDLSAPAERTEFAGETVEVVRGETVLPVVTDNAPENRWAAMFLARTVEETCGRRPRTYVVLPGQRCDFAKGLFIGALSPSEEDPRTNGSPAAFRVVARDGSVRFLGRADYAVFDWCERALGMRYYCAGGKCLERRAEIVVPAVDYSDAPKYDRRVLSGNPTWARIAKAGSEHRGGVAVHAPHGWFRDSELVAAHPEIFETGRTPMLCYGNPATLACYEDRIDRQLVGRGDAGGIVDTRRKVVTVSQWDAPIRCRCDWCRPLFDSSAGKGDSASPIIWGRFLPQLAAWLAKTHPDYMISFLPYLNTVEPPGGDAGLAALGNCEAEVCTMPGLALLKDRSVRDREEGILRDWQRVTGRKVLNWNYGCWPLDFTSAPYVFGRTAQRHLAAMTETVSGTFVCGGEGDPRIALSMYVWMKCLWNPDLDVEAVYDEFARRMFGPAARPMRALVDLQETCWERTWESTLCTYRNVFEISYPPADVARMKALLDEAWQLTENDAAIRARVLWYAGGLDRFFEEQEAALKAASAPETVLGVGDTREMVPARVVGETSWAKTTVALAAARPDGILDFVVRCDDPAAAMMDFSRLDDDYVRGDDCVTFAFEGLGRGKVFKDGSRKGDFIVAAAVTHDRTGWTVRASVKVPDPAARRVRGNVCRWRVGDRRQPSKSRVPGSRYEHSRLKTVFTAPDDDPAAFVTFEVRSDRIGNLMHDNNNQRSQPFPDVMRLVDGEAYFVVHAQRQAIDVLSFGFMSRQQKIPRDLDFIGRKRAFKFPAKWWRRRDSNSRPPRCERLVRTLQTLCQSELASSSVPIFVPFHPYD